MRYKKILTRCCCFFLVENEHETEIVVKIKLNTIFCSFSCSVCVNNIFRSSQFTIRLVIYHLQRFNSLLVFSRLLFALFLFRFSHVCCNCNCNFSCCRRWFFRIFFFIPFVLQRWWWLLYFTIFSHFSLLFLIFFMFFLNIISFVFERRVSLVII